VIGKELESGPSDVIFPTQQVTIRFNHAKHVSKEVGATGVLGMRFGDRKLTEKGMKPWGQHGFTATKLQSAQ